MAEHSNFYILSIRASIAMAIRFARVLKPDWWAPLVDGTYAIVLTLLVIELPSVVLEVLHDYNHQDLGLGALIDSLARIIAGYFAIFLIVWDVWVKKRCLLEISERFFRRSALESFALITSLFLATLLPPFYFVFNAITQQAVKRGPDLASSWLEKIEYDVVVVSMVLLIMMIYAFIGLAASRRIRQLKQRILSHASSGMQPEAEMREACTTLRGLRVDVLMRVVLAPLLFVLGRLFDLPTPIPGLAYALTGLWHAEPKED